MRLRTLLLLPLLCGVFMFPLVSAPSGAQGNEQDDTHYTRRRKAGRCLCKDGQGTWEYLKSPMRPPNDPPHCGLLMASGNCGSKPAPSGVSRMCWSSQKEECFWKRHAYSWDIKCSECWACSDCEHCDKMIGKPDPKVKAMLARQLKIEGHDGRKRKLYMAVSPHFYVVTDLHRKVKVPTKGGAPRVASGHEIAHLYAQRCERAYNDFSHWFRGRVVLGRPMGVYLMHKKRTAEQYALAYLGSANTDMLYGGGSKKVAGGFCGNGFVGSLQEERGDTNLHAYCRHMIGHILFSCWQRVDPKELACPKWAFIGSAHFLEKMLEPHEDYATFCSEETSAPTGSGKDWMKKARGLAAKKIDPIETFFSRKSLGAFKYKDHIRAWSIMHLGMHEDRDRWLDVLSIIRQSNEEGLAFKQGMGLSPDQFNERWRDRLTGKRPSLGDVGRSKYDDPDDPGRRERGRIQSTEEADTLAGLIRGVHKVEDVKLAKVIVARMKHESDLVRESIQVVLERTESEEVLAFLREEGLTHKDKMVRAGVARVLGSLKHAPARELLEALLKDGFWLARANAAWALAELKDKRSMPHILKRLGEKQKKAWIALADAYASFGEPSKEATLHTMPRLSDVAWQVRVTACRALASYGTAECMDALIKRFETERGRLFEEIYKALKAVSKDDLGRKPQTWAVWWEQQKELYGGFDPNPPPTPPNPADDRYAPSKPRNDDDPHYYGRRIYSRAVGFVFDTSMSMDKNITIPKGASTRLGNIPVSGTRMQVAKQVLSSAIKKLDPRTRFSLVFFSTNVRPWKKQLVPASPGNTKGAAGAIKNAPADGETNIHGALKAALGLHDKSSMQARLENIPDTVYFLTDGSPTRGEITSAPELLSWFADLNRFAKVRLHVVAFGTLGVDLDFLEALAKAGDGDFIHVPEE